MKKETRIMDEKNTIGGENGHTRLCQSETNLNLDWDGMDKKFTKIGRNGYNQKDLSNCVRHMSLNDFNITLESLKNSTEEREVVQSGTYAGRRDVSNPGTVSEKQIISTRGSVRGFKNRVRAGIATFLQDLEGNQLRNYKQLEKGKIVIYTTNMTIIRETHERCKKVKKILQTHMVRYEEKDLFMSKENQKELMDRLGTNTIILPQVFADGASIGSLENLENMNECGELRQLLSNFTKIDVKSSCDRCGGYRFIPCTFCHGSKKSLKRNNFTEEFCALRCMQCDENGLLRCDMCLDQQE